MAWATSFVVTVCISAGFWRRHTTKAVHQQEDLLGVEDEALLGELVQPSSRDQWEDVETLTCPWSEGLEHARLRETMSEALPLDAATLPELTTGMAEETQVDCGAAPPWLEPMTTNEVQAQVDTIRREFQLATERSSAHAGFNAGELFLNASASDELWCPKPSDEEGAFTRAEIPTSSPAPHCRILACLGILSTLCCCACCRRCFSKTTKDEEEDEEASEDEEGEDEETTQDDEVLQVADAEVQTEGELHEMNTIPKKEHGHGDLQHRLMDLPTPVRALATVGDSSPTRSPDLRESQDTSIAECSSTLSSPTSRVEAEDDSTRAERLLQEKRWVLDDPSGIIFEEEEDELEFHRKRSMILGCFARAFRDQLSIREAAEALLDDIDRLEEEKRDAVGDAAYWRSLAEDLVSKNNPQENVSLEPSEVTSPATSMASSCKHAPNGEGSPTNA